VLQGASADVVGAVWGAFEGKPPHFDHDQDLDGKVGEDGRWRMPAVGGIPFSFAEMGIANVSPMGNAFDFHGFFGLQAREMNAD